MISDQVTVSFCPIRYCNFSSTEVNDGDFLLSSFDDDQCEQCKTGQACGNCDSGYTLSFEFDDCVNDNDCSLYRNNNIENHLCNTLLDYHHDDNSNDHVFKIMINIVYLYGIIYYYSVVDILLGQVINYSNGLDVIDKIITSIVRLSPGFVGFMPCEGNEWNRSVCFTLHSSYRNHSNSNIDFVRYTCKVIWKNDKMYKQRDNSSNLSSIDIDI